MIPYGRQEITKADIEAVVEVLGSDFITQGPVLPRFEEAVARSCGAKFGVAVNSATSALHIACLALNLGPGDSLWTSPNTFVASANCALYCGADVDFVDIDPRTYNLCPEALRSKLELAKIQNKLPKVVIPVHFAGQSCDMKEVYALAQEYGFRVVEDASHAIGARYTGQSVGCGQYSDITVFSFHPVKIITTGEGGMAMTGDPLLADRMKRLRSHGISTQIQLQQSRPVDEIWNYQQVELGFNYRMTELQAALGLSQLSRLEDYIDRRQKIAARYNQAFANINITTPWQHPDTYSSYHLYPIRIRADESGISQREMYDSLVRVGIAANLHYIPVHRQPFYEALGFERGYCAEAERYHREAITLPLYPTLAEDEQNHVIDVVSSSIADAGE